MRTALLVVDLEQDLCRDDRRRDLVEAALPAILSLIERCADAGALVVYTRFALPPDDPQFARFGDTYCVEGTEGAQLITELQPLRGPVVTKRKHSVFFETELDDILRAAEVTRLLFAGLQTHICIQTSIADASFRGYDAIAIRDCVLSSNEYKNEQALEWIAAYVGTVIGLDDALAMIEAEVSGR